MNIIYVEANDPNVWERILEILNQEPEKEVE